MGGLCDGIRRDLLHLCGWKLQLSSGVRRGNHAHYLSGDITLQRGAGMRMLRRKIWLYRHKWRHSAGIHLRLRHTYNMQTNILVARSNDSCAAGIISGYECGGSMRRDYAALWYDKETVSFHSTTMFYAGAAPSDIKKTPELVYDVAGQPYTADTLPIEPEDPGYYEGEANYYDVNDEYVTVERYQEVRDRYGLLYSAWY